MDATKFHFSNRVANVWTLEFTISLTFCIFMCVMYKYFLVVFSLFFIFL